MDASLRVRIDRRRLCFLLEDHAVGIHATPKVAATAIRNACLKTIGIDVAADPDDQKEARPHLVAVEEVPSGFELVATVRHPVDRAVSLWADKICGAGRLPHGLKQAGFRKRMPFRQFAERLARTQPDDPHAAPQAALLSGLDRFGKVEILRFEDLSRGWSLLRERLPGLGGLPTANTTQHRVRDKALREAGAIALCREIYRVDLETFDYA